MTQSIAEGTIETAVVQGIALGWGLFVGTAVGFGAELAQLEPNTWTPLSVTVEQPPDADASTKGNWGPAGWNKLVYDPDGRRVLFYDRWVDERHGGGTIYGNCLFGLDPATGVLKPLQIDHWTVQRNPNSYWTIPLTENAAQPTPCPRHVYHCFDYVPRLKSIFLCNGANGTAAIGGKLVYEKECENTWRLDLVKQSWSQVKSGEFPPNGLDSSMAYCPDIDSFVYSGSGKLWIMDVAAGKWRKAKVDVPTGGGGQTIVYDPPRRRMLIAGGMTTDPSVRVEGRMDKDHGCNKLYAFDPQTETIARLADCPTALYASHLAYDARHDLFLIACSMKYGDAPAGTYRYDPRANAWSEVRATNPPPDPKHWFGWLRMCYDSTNDFFVGLSIYEQWFAFRYEP